MDDSALMMEAAHSIGCGHFPGMNCVSLYNQAKNETDFDLRMHTYSEYPSIEKSLKEKIYIDPEIAFRAARAALAVDHKGEIMHRHHNPQWILECAGVQVACEYVTKHAYENINSSGLFCWIQEILYCTHKHANDLLRAMLPAIKLRQYTFDVWHKDQDSEFAGLVCGWHLSDDQVDSILHHENLRNLMEVASMFDREEVIRFQRAALLIEKRWIAFNLARTHRSLLDVCMSRRISGCAADLVCIHGMGHSPRAVALCQL